MERIRGFEFAPNYKNLAKSLNQELPRRGTSRSSGYDIRAMQDATINPREIKVIDTGLTAYMQDDEELQIRSRSGLAIKGVTVVNAPGTIDADYYGKQIKVILINLSDKPFEIEVGDRIAQGVFCKYLITDDDNPAKDTRTGGFGSTGIK